jgi:hypothetical protein
MPIFYALTPVFFPQLSAFAIGWQMRGCNFATSHLLDKDNRIQYYPKTGWKKEFAMGFFEMAGVFLDGYFGTGSQESLGDWVAKYADSRSAAGVYLYLRREQSSDVCEIEGAVVDHNKNVIDRYQATGISYDKAVKELFRGGKAAGDCGGRSKEIWVPFGSIASKNGNEFDEDDADTGGDYDSVDDEYDYDAVEEDDDEDSLEDFDDDDDDEFFDDDDDFDQELDDDYENDDSFDFEDGGLDEEDEEFYS